MDESRTADKPQVSIEKNNLLTPPYSKEEVKKAIFQLKHNKAPCPDCFLLCFIKKIGILLSRAF
jgi:hypothetical protein